MPRPVVAGGGSSRPLANTRAPAALPVGAAAPTVQPWLRPQGALSGMGNDTDSPFRGAVDDVRYEARPEWLAGRNWWRIYVAGNPKVLVRYRESAIEAGRALAADEARFRREAAAGG